MITPKYKLSIVNQLKEEVESSFTDSVQMLSMLTSGIIESGDLENILASGNSIVITETGPYSIRKFGNEEEGNGTY